MLVEDLFLAESVDEISDEADFGSDLGLDSVGFVELATIVGEVFELKVTDVHVGQGYFRTLRRVVEFVTTQLQEKSSTGETVGNDERVVQSA
jgi:acyl carrier protein